MSRKRGSGSVGGLLRDDMDVHGRGFAQEAMDDREIHVFAPVSNRSSPEDHLGDVLGTNKFGNGVRDAGSFKFDDLCAEIFSEPKIGGEDRGIFLARTQLAFHVDDI